MQKKKWYKITFYANLTKDDVKAMNGSFFAAMAESMEINECEGLQIDEENEVSVQSKSPFNVDIDVILHEDDYEIDEGGTLIIHKESAYEDKDTKFSPGDYLTIYFPNADDCGDVAGEVFMNEYKVLSEDYDNIYCEFIRPVPVE